MSLIAISGCGGQPSEDSETSGGVPRPTLNMVLEGTGPSNLNSINVTGSAQPSATVDLYSNPACSTFISSTTADGSGNFAFSLTVTDDTTNVYFAKQTTSAGTSACSSTYALFVEDSTANAPTLSSSPASPNSSNSPSITASTEANAIVYLYTDASCTVPASPASGTANSSGALSVPVSVGSDSTTNFYSKITDVAGNTSSCASTAYTYVEDSTNPALPSVSSVTPTGPADNNNPVVAGTAEANVGVRFYADATCSSQIASGTADGSGNFSISLSVANDSTTTVYWMARDAAGNQSACSAPSNFTYVEDSGTVTPTLTSITPNSPANNNNPVVAGTAETGATVYLYSDACSTVIFSGTATGGGNFTIPISVGDNTTTNIYAKAQDTIGNWSGCTSSALQYVEDSTAPSIPSLTSTTPNVTGTTTTPTVNGNTNEVGAAVVIYSDSGCTTAVGSGTAGGSGNFAISVTVASNTTTGLYAKATDAAGNTLGCSSTPLNYTHDNVAPALPVFTGTTPSSPSNSNTPTINGTAEAGATVKLYSNSACTNLLNSGTASGGGTFGISITVPSNVTMNIYGKATDAAGNSSGCTTSFDYVEDSNAPNAPAITSTSPTGPNTDDTPNVVGTSEFYSQVLIYANSSCTGTLYGTGSTNGTGSFNFALTTSLPSDTTSTLYAKAVDLAGNIGACSSTAFNYTEDSTPPNPAPTLASSSPASPSNDETPDISGTTEANSTVYIYSDPSCTTQVGTGSANGSGNFTVNVSLANDTSYNLYVVARDPAGNYSSCMGSLPFVEDSTAPAAPTVSTSVPYLRSDLQAATIDGTAEALATVNVYSDAGCTTAAGSDAADGAGVFSAAITAPYNQVISYYATATDLAGNTSACSGTFASYEAYNIPDGVGVFKGNSLIAGTNLNQVAASPMQFSTADFDSGTYTHSTQSNSEKIYVDTAGDYQISVNVPGSGAVNGAALRIDVRVNGVDKNFARAQNYYTSNVGGNRESSIGATYLLEGLAANDYIDVTVQRHGATGTVNLNGNFQVYLEQIAAARTIFTANTTTGLVAGNINTPNTLVWTDVTKDSGFTHTDGTADINLDSVGTYVIYANIPTSGGVTNGNVKVTAKINGSPIAGGEAKQGYISGAPHVQSSAHWTGIVTTSSANSVLTFTTAAEGNTGTLTIPGSNPASLFVERLSTTADVLSIAGTALQGGSVSFNPTSYTNVDFPTENLEDGSIYSHGASTEQVQVSTFGDYLLMFNSAHSAATARVNSQYKVTVNGTPVSDATCSSFFIRNQNGQTESSGTMVYLLRRLNANDVVRMSVIGEANTGAITSQGTSVMMIRKPYQP